MKIGTDLVRELLQLVDVPVALKIITLFERDASRDGRDSRVMAAERARRYRANKSRVIVAACSADTTANVTHAVTLASRDGDNCASKKGTSDLQSGNREVRKKETDGVIGRAKVSRGTRLSDDWTPNDKDLQFARDRGLRPDQIEVETTKFRNYWTNRTDRHASKPQWWRAWQNWILNAKGAPNGYGGSRQLQDDSRSVSRAATKLQEQLAQGAIEFAPRPSLLPTESESDIRLLPKG